MGQPRVAPESLLDGALHPKGAEARHPRTARPETAAITISTNTNTSTILVQILMPILVLIPILREITNTSTLPIMAATSRFSLLLTSVQTNTSISTTTQMSSKSAGDGSASVASQIAAERLRGHQSKVHVTFPLL